MIDGTHEDSYASMPLYCQQLIEANPGSVISLKKKKQANSIDCSRLIVRQLRVLLAASPFLDLTEPTCTQSIKESCSLQLPWMPKGCYSPSCSASLILKIK